MFPSHRLFGFDSFKGLPQEDADKLKIGVWKEGNFLPAASLETIIQEAGGPEIAQVVPGFFNESLHSGLVAERNMGPAFYVEIDCDLYASTFPALDFLFSNNI